MRTVLFSTATFVLMLATQPASAKIVHRWSFDKDSADSVGGAHARLEDGAAVREGRVAFDGQNNWISLPIGKTIEKLSSATFETWVTCDNTQSAWARVFDFGRNQDVSLFFTIRSGRAEQGGAAGMPRFSITTGGLGQEQQISGTEPFPLGKLTHVAVTIDAEKKVGKLYINGKEAGTREMTHKPSDLGNTTQNWLGVSQYTTADPLFQGAITEFRIYDTAISADEIAQSFKAGPDELVTKPDAARPAADDKAAPAAKAEDKATSDKQTSNK